MILQGRLTRDPELKTTPNGVEVCNFTVAWSDKYKDNERQCFLNCNAWRQTGVFVDKYFKKGQEIAVEGQLETRKYQDKDGNNRSVTELTCDKVHFCGPKQGGGGQDTYQQPEVVQAGPEMEEIELGEDELPF